MSPCDETMTEVLRTISVPLERRELSPLVLSEDAFYYVASGALNVFASSIKEDNSLGSRFFAAHFDKGELLFPAFSMQGPEARNCIIADALPGTEVLRICKSVPKIIKATGGNDWLTGQFNSWADRMSSSLATGKMPYACRILGENDLAENKGVFNFDSGDCFRPEKELLWVTVKNGFCVLCGNEEGLLLAEGSVFPLSSRLWLKCLDDTSVEGVPSKDFISSTLFIRRLKEFYEFFFRSFLLAVTYRKDAEITNRKELAEMERKAMDASLQELASLGKSGSLTGTDISAEAFSNRFIGALEFICRGWKMKFNIPDNMPTGEKGENSLRLILEASSVFYRKIKLSSGWWRKESSPMIAFNKDDIPVGLTYDKSNHKYSLFNALEGSSSLLTEKDASTLSGHAYVLYPQFSPGEIGVKDLLTFSFHGLSPVFRAVFLTGMAGGGVSLLYPFLTGIIFNSVIPHAEHFQLFQMGAILLTAAISMTVFSMGRSLSVLRIKTLSDFHLQSAIVGRLMKMPLPFFKRFSTGELAQRVMGVEVIREILADNVTNALFSMLFATPNLLLMFYYNWRLAMVALAFLSSFLLILGIVGAVDAKNHRFQLQAEGELEGFVIQVLSGINKIRNSISEDRAFIRWASKFAEGTRWRIRSIKNSNFIIILDSFSPALASCLFFYLAGETWKGSMNIGEYLSFSSAFTAFMSPLMLFAGSMPSLIAVISLLARMKPILQTATEQDNILKSPGELDGRLELSRVSYRYTQDSPPVLRNVSLSAAPGEFIGVVGPSGAGKSTLVRLLLGFETPESGGIYYSGQDINAVSRRELRKQIGAVLQNGVLEPGSIYDNIAASSSISMDEAWDAARMSGCDKDIEEMPMGMHTFVTGGTVSGGQKQRILIARAVAKKPRVIIFDEATSAVDNETQAKITERLRKMNATRIVVAHRLSTIEQADRIYVLDKGQIVQQGTFKELVNTPGVFCRLAKRQMV